MRPKFNRVKSRREGIKNLNKDEVIKGVIDWEEEIEIATEVRI